MNRDLFANEHRSSTESRRIELPGADLTLFDQFFSERESESLLTELLPGGEIQWRQEDILAYGRLHRAPRLTAWYGEPGTAYVYSGIRHEAIAWTRTLLRIKQRIDW